MMAELFFREKLEELLSEHHERYYSDDRYAGRLVLDGEDLSGVDLSGLDLSGVSFRNTNLAGADLSGSMLNDADFSGADLTGVTLEGSSVINAAFIDANVYNVNLEGADLSFCDFGGACLWFTDLSEAKTDETNLRGASLEAEPPEVSDLAYAYESTKQSNVTAGPQAEVELSEISDDTALDILNRIKSEVDSYKGSGEWKDYLKTLNMFSNYSPYNANLISMQKPNASLVAGYGTWKKLGRYVTKGEKAIKIVLPVFQERETEAVLDDGSTQKKTEHVIVGWHVKACVFDVSQTTGKKLPELNIGLLDSEMSNYDVVFDSIAAASPCPMSFGEMPGTSYGYYDARRNSIGVNKELPEMQTVKTMVHEVAHAEHCLSGEFKDLSREAREILAESTAFLVMEHYGLDTSDYSIPYVAAWSADMNVSEFGKAMGGVKLVRDRIIEKVDYYMTHEKERRIEAEKNLVSASKRTKTKSKTEGKER